MSISIPSNMKLFPDIKVITTKAADTLTGDGFFADTDLVRIPFSGWLLTQLVVSATGDSLVYVPQIGHQENRSNHMPVINSGAAPAIGTYPMYKIWVEKGMTPRILYDEVSDTVATGIGLFFKGRKNPVGMNTPDILVVKNITATTQNCLESTDLEDCPFPGYLLVWTSAAVNTTQIQIQQAGHQTGNYSLSPIVGSGLNVNIFENAPFKYYVPATGNPTVTATLAGSDNLHMVAAFYIDWGNVPQSMIRRMGL